METDKDGKPGRRRNLMMVELTDDHRQRIALMARHNGMSVSAAARLLIQKALKTPPSDRFIAIEIPEEALLSSSQN